MPSAAAAASSIRRRRKPPGERSSSMDNRTDTGSEVANNAGRGFPWQPEILKKMVAINGTQVHSIVRTRSAVGTVCNWRPRSEVVRRRRQEFVAGSRGGRGTPGRLQRRRRQRRRCRRRSCCGGRLLGVSENFLAQLYPVVDAAPAEDVAERRPNRMTVKQI